jgi:hypothetical protein
MDKSSGIELTDIIRAHVSRAKPAPELLGSAAVLTRSAAVLIGFSAVFFGSATVFLGSAAASLAGLPRRAEVSIR